MLEYEQTKAPTINEKNLRLNGTSPRLFIVYMNYSIVPLTGEIWKDIPITEGKYQASSLGRIRNIHGGKTYRRCSIMKPRISQGYFRINLLLQGRHKTLKVHRLVASAFLAICPPHLVVNHISGVKTDNQPQNLEYVTRQYNVRHAHRIGLFDHCRSRGSVRWHTRHKRWHARFSSNNKQIHVGYFNRKLDALSHLQDAMIQDGRFLDLNMIAS